MTLLECKKTHKRGEVGSMWKSLTSEVEIVLTCECTCEC
jgi:hypothetical protein